MESAILLNNIIATIDETSEGLYPVGFLHRDMNVNTVSNKVAKTTNRSGSNNVSNQNTNPNTNPNTNSNGLSSEHRINQDLAAFKKRLRQLRELRDLHERKEVNLDDTKKYLGGGVVLTNLTNTGDNSVRKSAFHAINKSNNTPANYPNNQTHAQIHAPTHAQDQVYDVKYNALTVYLLADLTLRGMLNFSAVNSIFTKYLHFETELMENHLHSKEYIYDSVSGVIFPSNFIQFTNSTRVMIDDALLAAYRLITISNILAIHADESIPQKTPLKTEGVVDDCMRGLLIKHISCICTVLESRLFDRSDNNNNSNNSNHNNDNSVKNWELRMFILALNRVVNILKRFGIDYAADTALISANIDTDIDTDKIGNVFITRDYSLEKLKRVLSKTPAALDSFITNLSSMSSKNFLHTDNALDASIESTNFDDRSDLIPFVLMTDDELDSNLYSNDNYTTDVHMFLEHCKTALPVHVHKTDSFIGLIGSGSQVDTVLTLLVYSRLYRMMSNRLPIINVDDTSFMQVKQNIMYIVNNIDTAFCKKKNFDISYSNTEKTMFFNRCETVPYLVPISLVYAVVTVITTTVANQTLLKDIDLDCGKDEYDSNGDFNNPNSDVYPLLQALKINPLINYGTINKNSNQAGPNETRLSVVRTTKGIQPYPKKFKRPFINTSGLNYPFEKTERIETHPIKNITLEDILSIVRSSNLSTTLPTDNTTEQSSNAVCTTKYCRCSTTIPAESSDPTLSQEKIEELDKSLESKSVVTIDDLILLGKTYHCQSRKTFKGVDLKKIADLVDPLTAFNQMKGLTDIKQKIVNNVMYFLKKGKRQGQIWNMAIYGPPGVGKTTIAKHVANIYSKAGILSTNKVESIKRSDLVGKYLGETAIKTQDVINRVKGGILLIDEVYSLGHPEKRDSFSKECLDTLTHNLGQEDTDFICIVAGYEEDVKNCFFAQNKGLQRRFPFVYRVDEYDGKIMGELTLTKLRAEGWSVNDTDKDVVTKFINDNKEKFANFMGDVENFVLRLEILNNSESMFNDTDKKLSVELLQKTLDDIICAPKEKEKKSDDESWRRMYI